MAAFTVVYIQLTALQVGAKYLKRGLIVMSESLEDLKAIIDNAPEGAVSVFNGIYLDNKRNFWSDGWFGIHDYIEVKQPVRSLSDIKRIIELMELMGGVK